MASSKISAKRQSKILSKLVVGKDSAKRRWFQDTGGADSVPKLQTASSLSSVKRQGKNAPRRVHVLNKLFMKHITDLMSTGEVSDTLLGHGLEITHVKVTPDFSFVNVYWLTKKSSADGDADMEAILRRAAGHIRHELSQLKVMGEVPRINFVKNRIQSKFADIDELLERADFGEDFEPTAWKQLRHDFVASRPDGGGGSETTAAECFELPAMRHDVLGLDQRDIMDKIKRAMSKNRQAWQEYEQRKHVQNSDVDGGMPMVEFPVTATRSMQAEMCKLRDDEFAKFLGRRKFMLKKRASTKTRKNPDFREHYYDRAEFDDDADDWLTTAADDYLVDDDVNDGYR